jgi:hypothetical protein
LSDSSADALLSLPLVNAMLERLADLVVQRLRAGSEVQGSYYTTQSNPLNSARAFRDAARRGHFRSFKLGRMIAAQKADVHAWIESRKVRPPSAPEAKPLSEDEAMLQEFGLQATRRGSKSYAKARE